MAAIGPSREGVEQLLAPRSFSGDWRGQFEDYPTVGCTTARPGGAVKRSIDKSKRAVRARAIGTGSSVARKAEEMKHRLYPCAARNGRRRKLEYASVVARPTVKSCAVKIACTIE